MLQSSIDSSLNNDVNLGSGQAEFDPFLEDAFLDSGEFRALSSFEDRRCFVVGRTGSGKSAVFQRLLQTHAENVVVIPVQDLMFQHVVNLDVLAKLQASNVNAYPFLKYLWKHCLITEALRFRYQIQNEEDGANAIAALTRRFSKNAAKMEAVSYLDRFGGSFWSSFDERLRELVDRWANDFHATFGAKASGGLPFASASANAETVLSDSNNREQHTQLTQRYQRWINEAQLSKLNAVVRILDTEIIQTPTYIVIDHLDEMLVDRDATISVLKGLLACVYDLNRDVRNLKILVALRPNIFQQLRMGSDPFGQQEKYRDLSMTMSWTKEELVSMLNLRAAVASETYRLDPPFAIPSSLPSRPYKESGYDSGNALDYLLDRTLLRPRDAISFFNLCLRKAVNKSKIGWFDIIESEPDYSSDRFQALVDEWKDPYNEIEKLFRLFERSPNTMDRKSLRTVLDRAALLLPDPDFHGNEWLTEYAMPIWDTYDSTAHWWDSYGTIVTLLVKVSFLGVSNSFESPVEFSCGSSINSRKLADLGPDDSCVAFAVHPAYRTELKIGYRPKLRHRNHSGA